MCTVLTIFYTLTSGGCVLPHFHHKEIVLTHTVSPQWHSDHHQQDLELRNTKYLTQLCIFFDFVKWIVQYRGLKKCIVLCTTQHKCIPPLDFKSSSQLLLRFSIKIHFFHTIKLSLYIGCISFSLETEWMFKWLHS